MFKRYPQRGREGGVREYISFLSLLYKLSQIYHLKKEPHLLYHGFCRSGVWSQHGFASSIANLSSSSFAGSSRGESISRLIYVVGRFLAGWESISDSRGYSYSWVCGPLQGQQWGAYILWNPYDLPFCPNSLTLLFLGAEVIVLVPSG